MRFWSLAIAAVLLAGSVFAQERDTEKDTDKVRLVATGEIRKIDEKKKTFQFKITLDTPGAGRGNAGNRPPARGGGGRGGGGRRGGGYPGSYPGRGTPNQQVAPATMEVKVYTTIDTALKNNGREAVDFSTFKVGQHVAVTGIHTGNAKSNDLQALEVDRTQD